MSFPFIRKIATVEERGQIYAAIKNDNDNLDHATHVWVRDGEIVGAASINAVPVLMLWHDSKKFTPRDSLHAQRIYEAIFESLGFPKLWVLCDKKSPYNQHMSQMGCKPIWSTDVFTAGTKVNELGSTIQTAPMR